MPSCSIHAVTTNINVTPLPSFEMAETGMSFERHTWTDTNSYAKIRLTESYKIYQQNVLCNVHKRMILYECYRENAIWLK